MYDGYDPYAPDPDEEWRYNQGRTAVPKSEPVAPAPTEPQWNEWGIPPNSNQPAGTMDLSYWLSRGVTPDQIFDENGQTRPGWTRTANGYEQTGAQTQTADPYASSNYPTTYGGGGGEYGSYQPPSRTSLSALNYPSFNAPRMQAPPAFSYENFTAPTLEEAQNEPGFDYALKQGVKAYENSKAYTGTYRGGATIKGINDYARNMANQNYGQVFERKAQTYDRNRGNAADTYMTNYGVSRDVFDRNYSAAKDEYAPQARASELQYGRDWDLFAYEGDDTYRRWKALIDANTT